MPNGCTDLFSLLQHYFLMLKILPQFGGKLVLHHDLLHEGQGFLVSIMYLSVLFGQNADKSESKAKI